MKRIGYIFDREKGYLNVFDVSFEKEYIDIVKKIKYLKIKGVKIIKKPDETIGAIEFFLEKFRYELTIDRRGSVNEKGIINWRYVPGVFIHDACLFCKKDQRICNILELFKTKVFRQLIEHKDIRLHWIFEQ
jgi:hypothetical protein